MTGAASLLSRLSLMPGRAHAAASRACLECARTAAEKAKQGAPVKTGTLRASISAQGTSGAARVSVSVPYAGIAEARRPYLSPAAQAADFQDHLARALKEGLR